MTRSRNGLKNLLIVIAILALLLLLTKLFLLPPEPARDLVFGELGRTPSALTNRTESTLPPPVIAPTNITRAARTTVPSPLAGSNENFGITPIAQLTNDTLSNAVVAAMAAPPLFRGSRESSDVGAASNGDRGITSPMVRASPESLPPLAPIPERGPFHPVVAGAPYAPAENPESDTKPSTAELLATTKGYAPPPTVDTRPKTTAALLGVETDNAKTSNPLSAVRPRITSNVPLLTVTAETNVSYVVDQSLSMMRDGKTTRARMELLNSLENLDPGRTFYILFFHSGGYEGMPGLGPAPATPENIQAMTNWLFSVGHRFGSDPAKAIRRALRMVPAPQIVWLISDGGFSENAVQAIRDANATVNAHINTIGVYDAEGARIMRQIANENGGTFRFISPP